MTAIEVLMAFAGGVIMGAIIVLCHLAVHLVGHRARPAARRPRPALPRRALPAADESRSMSCSCITVLCACSVSIEVPWRVEITGPA
jgi:hypothetical protein